MLFKYLDWYGIFVGIYDVSMKAGDPFQTINYCVKLACGANNDFYITMRGVVAIWHYWQTRSFLALGDIFGVIRKA